MSGIDNSFGANPPAYNNPTFNQPTYPGQQFHQPLPGQTMVSMPTTHVQHQPNQNEGGLAGCALAIVVVIIILVVGGILAGIGYGIYVAVAGATATVNAFNTLTFDTIDNIPTITP